MLEILKIIILTCQVSTGSVVPATVDRYQRDCQKNLISCVKPESGNGTSTTLRLIKCIKERE